VVQVENSHLVAMTIDGDFSIIAPSVTLNAAGLRMLSTGDWVVADVDSGRLLLVDGKTGGSSTLTGGFNWPNGIEIGSEDRIYVTDFSTGRIQIVDLDDPSTMTIVASGLQQPNGIGLSPDADVLYVLESWRATVLAFDLQKDGSWGSPREFHYTQNGNFQGLNVDACGNVYWTDVSPNNDSTISHIWRKPAGTGDAELIAALPSGYVSNLRFGTGLGGWERDVLYASDRYEGRIFSLEVGVPGRPHPAE
jgi:sugar lactone lactonase YvrE